jgi:hypothetical protein
MGRKKLQRDIFSEHLVVREPDRPRRTLYGPLEKVAPS